MRYLKWAEALEYARYGSPIIIMDDLGEMEGDICCPAQGLKKEVVQFMVNKASGLLCLSMPKERLEEMGIPRMTEALQALVCLKYDPELVLRPSMRKFSDSLENRLAHTPFHFPVDQRGQHSGISAADRLATIGRLLEEDATIDDFDVPGHLMLLGAQTEGLRQRVGHTEAAYDLARHAGLAPAAALCEVLSRDGSMSRGRELEAFAAEHAVSILLISEALDALNIALPPAKT